MKKWTFDIQPRNNFTHTYVNAHSEDFTIGERLTEMPYCFYLGSKYFDQHDNPKNVVQLGHFITRLLSAYSYLVHKNKLDGGSVRIKDLYDSNNRKVNGLKVSTANNYSDIDNLIGNVNVSGKTSISKLINLAMKPGFIRNLLLIVGGELSYKSMYMALDEIKIFLRGKESVDSLIDKSKLNRFTHTANNFETIGIDARHGTSKHEKPKKPLNLVESQELITDLILKVLKKYFSLEFTLVKDRSNDFQIEDMFEEE